MLTDETKKARLPAVLVVVENDYVDDHGLREVVDSVEVEMHRD